MINGSQLIYLISVILPGLFILWWFKGKIDSLEEKNRSYIEDVNNFEAVKTRSPFKNPIRMARNFALESINNHFSIIRKTTFFLFILFWITLILIPFVGKVPIAIFSLLGATSAVILGIAARPFVENVISGIVISISNHIRTGDTVLVDDKYGTIEDITFTHTVVKLWDWRRYIIPNSRMLMKEFTNYSIHNTHIWAHVEFWIEYGADLDRVKDVAIQAASSNKYYIDSEPPQFWTMEMTKDSLKCWIAAWTKSPADAWQWRADVTTNLTRQFQAYGIRSHMQQHQWKQTND